jgi:hypothetical protein
MKVYTIYGKKQQSIMDTPQTQYKSVSYSSELPRIYSDARYFLKRNVR